MGIIIYIFLQEVAFKDRVYDEFTQLLSSRKTYLP